MTYINGMEFFFKQAVIPLENPSETGLRLRALGAAVYFISGLPQSDPCSARRLHRCAHETRSKDPG